MPLLSKEKFLEEIVSQVKFKYDRYDIKRELESHISDKMEYYIEQGYNRDEAERLSVNDMGDAKEIGKELDKQHNPILGWIWRITNIILTFAVLISIFIIGFPFGASLFNRNPIRGFPKESIVYKLDISEKVKLDDTVTHFTNIIYDVNGDLNIFYKSYDTRLWGTGWSHSYIGEIYDNLGNKYHARSGMSSGGIITKSVETVKEFSEEADTLIINFDNYNRKYKVEIPLQVGDNNE